MDREIMQEAVQRFGRERQLIKACEEMAELQQAICKLFDKSVDAFDLENVVEELVDVEITLEQVRIALNVDPEVEAGWRERKLRRLRRRLRA